MGRVVSGGIVVPGADKQVIFNDGGVLGADAGSTYDKAIDTLSTNLSLPDAGKITYDVAPAANTTATGDVSSETVGEDVVFGELLYLKADGKWWKADASTAATMPGLRVALAAISANNAGILLSAGVIRDDSWAWSIGGIMYASTTGGDFTQAVPSGAGEQIQIVGVALTATVIVFAPNALLTEVALDIETKDAGYTITWAELSTIPKTFVCTTGAGNKTFDFAAPGAGDVGKVFRIVKIDAAGAGTIIVDAPAGVYIDESSDGGTLTSTGSAIETITLMCVSTTQLVTVSSFGTWTAA